MASSRGPQWAWFVGDVCTARGSVARLCLAALLVLLFVGATHWPVLSAQALFLDDGDYLLDNLLVQHPSWHSVKRFVVEIHRPSTVPGYYHPLTMISLMFDYATGGRPQNLYAFHRTNLILHLSSTAFVILLIYSLFARPWVAAAVGLLFGVHPLVVEPIAWLGQRKALLAACLAFLSLLLYVRHARRSSRLLYAGSTLAFVLALLSKPTVTPLPLMMLLMDYWPLRHPLRRALLEKVPLFAIAALFTFITISSHVSRVEIKLPTEFPWMRTPLMVCHKLFFYLSSVFYPVNLTSYYPAPQPLTLSNAEVCAGLIGTILVVHLIVLSLKWTRAGLVAGLLWFVALLPILGIIGHSPVYVWDNYAYFPMIGILLVLAALLRLMPAGRALSPAHGAVRVGATLFVLFLAVTEAVYARRCLANWKDGERHYRHAIAHAPLAPILHDNLAVWLAGQGHLDEAVEAYEEALRLYPENVDAMNNLAIVRDRQGRFDEAMGLYTRVLSIDPRHFRAHCNLAAQLERRARDDEAIEHYKQALCIMPDAAVVHHRLGVAYARQRRIDLAVQELTEALRLDPNMPHAHVNLAELRLFQGDVQDAVTHYRKAIRYGRAAPATLDALAWLLATSDNVEVRDPDEAIKLALEACALTDFKEPGFLDTLAAAYSVSGQFDDAIKTTRQAITCAEAQRHQELLDRLNGRLALYEQHRPYSGSTRLVPP